MNVTTVLLTQKVPPNALEVDVDDGQKHECKYLLTPPTMTTEVSRKPLLSPLWIVQPTSNKKHVNMEWKKVDVEPSKTCPVKVSVPVLCNIVDIAFGVDLFIAKPKTDEGDDDDEEGEGAQPDAEIPQPRAGAKRKGGGKGSGKPSAKRGRGST